MVTTRDLEDLAPTQLGIRQGCTSAPALWSVAMWFVLQQAYLYADDFHVCDIFRTIAQFEQCLHRFGALLDLIESTAMTQGTVMELLQDCNTRTHLSLHCQPCTRLSGLFKHLQCVHGHQWLLAHDLAAPLWPLLDWSLHLQPGTCCSSRAPMCGLETPEYDLLP